MLVACSDRPNRNYRTRAKFAMLCTNEIETFANLKSFMLEEKHSKEGINGHNWYFRIRIKIIRSGLF